MPSRGSNATTVAFRVDGNEAVGAGHLTRCRSLAEGLRRAGMRIGFVLGEPSTAAAASLADEGFAVAIVPCASPAALDAADAAATAGACAAWRASALVVDHYGADAAYFERLAAQGLVLGAIDDLGDRDLRQVRWILNQNLGARDVLYGGARGRRLLLGPGYALLRPQFAEAHDSLARTFSASDRRVLVTLGGNAPAALYCDALAALDGVERPLSVRVVTGASGAPDPGLVAAAGTSHHDTEVLGRVDRMSDEIAWADVAVTAGGSTCWELLALGTPAAVVPLSRDQLPNVAALADHDLGVALGDGLHDAAGAVGARLADPARRRDMSARGQALVDGRGADRAAAALLSSIDSEVHRAAA